MRQDNPPSPAKARSAQLPKQPDLKLLSADTLSCLVACAMGTEPVVVLVLSKYASLGIAIRISNPIIWNLAPCSSILMLLRLLMLTHLQRG